jgi:hypothetical protein
MVAPLRDISPVWQCFVLDPFPGGVKYNHCSHVAGLKQPKRSTEANRELGSDAAQ